MNIIEINNLKKYYKVHKKEQGVKGSIKTLFKREYYDVKAVDDISLNIKEGEIVGFVGPNGAGKTTTLKCLSGLLYPTSGDVSILGFTPFDRKTEFLKQISIVMGQKNQLWWDLPAIETFQLNKEIYEIDNKIYKETLDSLVQMLEVSDLLNVQVRKLSLGQRMKMELIAGLIHRPKVLFLDEPTIGLDVVIQKRLREFIKSYNKEFNATIILTSHNMDDVKEVCERIVIIDTGKLIFDDSFEKLISKYANHKLITVTLESKIDQELAKQYGHIKEFDFLRFTVSVDKQDVISTAKKIMQDFVVTDLDIGEPRIEDIISEIFSGKDLS